MGKSRGASFEDFEEINKLIKEYWRKKEATYTYSTSLFNDEKEELVDKLEEPCYTPKKEEKNMSLMILIYDGRNTYIGTDSRETFKDGSYNDNCQKLFVNENKTMMVSSTGLSKKNINGELINFPKEMAELFFEGKDIYEILDTVRKNNQTYSDLIGDSSIHFFIAKKKEIPTIIDVNADEIRIVTPRALNRVYSNGDYDTEKVNNLVNDSLEEGYFCEDAIRNTIEHIIKVTNKDKPSTIGGEVKIEMI